MNPKISKSLLNEIFNQMPDKPPEVGGIIGGNGIEITKIAVKPLALAMGSVNGCLKREMAMEDSIVDIMILTIIHEKEVDVFLIKSKR